MPATGGKISLFNMMTYKVMTTFVPPPPASTYVVKSSNVVSEYVDGFRRLDRRSSRDSTRNDSSPSTTDSSAAKHILIPQHRYLVTSSSN
ncbi:hypothetical protein MKW98_004230 [Papaver atlanticum]|uniref:Uncharacterized protein n=1 Tax=Papaver atlanticum TaxID=357466 RepID=A0AAD4T8J1_9MAGN|nr:hypothetical protein MKW98_004230 [Papaver atlanticum]